MFEVYEVEHLPIGKLWPAEWNANRVPESVMAKIRRSLEEFGVVENLVVRSHPDRPGEYEVVSGNHRLRLYRERGMETVPCIVRELDDAHARLLAQTLNRTRGQDDPKAYARLLEEVLASLDKSEVLAFLPESESALDRALAAIRPPADPDEAPAAPEEPRSKPGELYELGPHRLLCGDATDPEQDAEAMGGGETKIGLKHAPMRVEPLWK